MSGLNEAAVEPATVGWLAGLGWSVAHGSEVNPDAAPAERADYSAVVLAAMDPPLGPAAHLSDGYVFDCVLGAR